MVAHGSSFCPPPTFWRFAYAFDDHAVDRYASQSVPAQMWAYWSVPMRWHGFRRTAPPTLCTDRHGGVPNHCPH